MSAPDPVLAELVAGLRGGGPDLAAPPLTLRPEYEALFATMPVAEDLSFAEVAPGGVPGLRINVPGSSGGLVLYLHGGGYVVGSAQGYRGLAGEVARAAGMDALVIDYRLAPEHPFPAAVDDALAAYRALLEDGRAPSSIVLAGDSAGGGLTLALLVALREAGDPLPAAALMISPWTDLTGKAGSIEGKRAEDPSLTPEGLAACAGHYLGGRDPSHPLASPALADLAGLPPLIVQVGSIEILLDDALAIAARAGSGGTHVTLEIVPGVPHVFHAFHFMLPQAKAALARAGAFLKERRGVSLPREVDTLVVGAGFSGLYLLHKLRQDGFSAHVVEAASGVGGTWFWNRYPGARCDIPSIEYSYSFDAELEREWRWSERYAAQPEILRYLEHVAERFDLNRDITLNTRVTAATWDETASRWLATTDGGAEITARFLILATGALSSPNPPDLPGLENFAGQIVMTAQWDDSVDLTGKSVCHFGTGSSGIQAVGEMARLAAQLTVFQRTPNFAVPASNHKLPPDYLDELVPQYPALREIARQSPLGWFTGALPGCAKADDPAAREARFEQQWHAGTTGLLTAYEDLLFDEESNAFAADFARRKIAALVRDPETARKLTPHGWPMGSRRLCSEINFYEAFNRANVALVDVREEAVVEVAADAVVTTEGRYPADILTFATGFDACVGAIKNIAITGRGGKALAREWDMGPRAYLGLAVAGFPNLFTVTGPGSPSVLSNVVVSIEQHVEWIARCLGDLRSGGKTVIEATPAAEQAWMEHNDEIAQMTLFPRSNSWYQGRTADGGQVFMPYVGGCGAYRAKCDEVAAAGYEGFELG